MTGRHAPVDPRPGERLDSPRRVPRDSLEGSRASRIVSEEASHRGERTHYVPPPRRGPPARPPPRGRGEPIGKVADLIVAIGDRYPPVTGLVVKTDRRR